MLACHLARGQVLHVLREQARRFLKFVESFVETLEFVVLRFLEFEARRKGLAGGFQVFSDTAAGRRTRGIRTQRWRLGWGSVRSQTHSDQQQRNSCWQPSHSSYYRMPSCWCLAIEILGRELRS